MLTQKKGLLFLWGGGFKTDLGICGTAPLTHLASQQAFDQVLPQTPEWSEVSRHRIFLAQLNDGETRSRHSRPLPNAFKPDISVAYRDSACLFAFLWLGFQFLV